MSNLRVTFEGLSQWKLLNQRRLCPTILTQGSSRYPPVVLVGKARELRRRTKNWGIHAKQEEVEVDIRELLTKNFSRPLRLLFTEPIIFLVSFYMSFVSYRFQGEVFLNAMLTDLDLQPTVPVPHGLSACVSGCAWIQPRGWRVAIFWHGRRCPLCGSLHYRHDSCIQP